MPPKNPWKKLSSKIDYRNPWFKVRKDEMVRPNQVRGEYFVVSLLPSVFVVPMTPRHEVCLIAQYRYITGIYSWEIPGGGSDGEKPLVAAKRELWEETGLRAKHWKAIGKFYPTNGLSDELSYIFLATGLTQGKDNRHELAEEGIFEIKRFPLKRVLEMIRLGQITDGQTISAIMQAALYLKLL